MDVNLIQICGSCAEHIGCEVSDEWSETKTYSCALRDMRVCLERKVVYLEDLTSPPLPLSSSCSLLSGGTRGAGLNYGEEVECDTDAGRGNSVSKARTEQDMPQSLLPHPETMRAIANHLLPLPSQPVLGTWTSSPECACVWKLLLPTSSSAALPSL